MSRTIALLNPGSASGKTTLAVNLATSLSLLEKRTLFIDCTSTGAGSRILMDEESSDFGVSDVMSGLVGARGAVVPGKNNWLDVMPASQGESDVETLLAHNPEKEKALSLSLRPLMPSYEFLIIDTPSGDGLFVQSALAASDGALVPIHPGWDVASQLKSATACADSVITGGHPRLKIMGLVCMGPADESELSFMATLPRCDAIQKGMTAGEAAAYVDVFSQGARACLELAMALVENPMPDFQRGTSSGT